MFEVSVAFNSLIDRIVSMPILGTIAKNPIYTALLITVCILVIVLIVFRNAETDESLLTLGIRCSFYVFVVSATLIFLNNHVLLTDTEHEEHGGRVNEIFTGSARTAGYDDIAMPVHAVAPTMSTGVLAVPTTPAVYDRADSSSLPPVSMPTGSF